MSRCSHMTPRAKGARRQCARKGTELVTAGSSANGPHQWMCPQHAEGVQMIRSTITKKQMEAIARRAREQIGGWVILSSVSQEQQVEQAVRLAIDSALVLAKYRERAARG